MNETKREPRGESARPERAASAGPLLVIGEPPWRYADNEQLLRLRQGGSTVTSEAVNRAAGLAWGVYQAPAYIYTGDPAEATLTADGYVVRGDIASGFKLAGSAAQIGSAPVPAFLMNVRDDSHRVLGVVKKRYRIFQNSEAPAFLDQLAQSGAMSYETAGSLSGGSQVWWLLKAAHASEIAGEPRERIENHFLLKNSHDGSMTMSIAVLPLRVCAQTTLAWSLPAAPRTAAIKHTDSAKNRTIEAQRALEIAGAYQAELAALAEKMLDTPISEEQFTAFLNTLVPTPTARVGTGQVSNQRGITMAENTKGIITQIYFHNQTQTHITGTVWGLVQACQYYSDHFTINRTTDGGTADENRFKRLTTETTLGNRAFTRALSLL